MTKLKAPLLSQAASGTIADQVTYQTPPTGPRAGAVPSHGNPQTQLQIIQRMRYFEAKQTWLMSDDLSKQVWRNEARNLPMTGYNRCLQLYLSGQLSGFSNLCLPSLDAKGTTLKDISNLNLNATLYGPTWVDWSPGYRLLSFNGINDYASVPHSLSLNLKSQFTIEALVYLRSITNFPSIIYKGGYSPQGYCYLFWASGEGFVHAFAFWYDGYWWSGMGVPPLSLGAWHHILTTKSDTLIRSYSDGHLENQASFSGDVADNTQPLIIGRPYITSYFNGYALALRFMPSFQEDHMVRNRYRFLHHLLPFLNLPPPLA